MSRFSALVRLSLVLALAIPNALAVLAPSRIYAAAIPHSTRCRPPSWHVIETANFRIHSYGTAPVSRQTAAACERQRDQLRRRWLADADPGAWSPKCQVVIHPTDDSYLRETGHGPRTTVASSLVDRKDGQISLRRIDVRATNSNWLPTAFAHELAHVVLAERFVEGALPRWIDEGIAILADSPQRREGHERALKQAVRRGTQFRLVELLALADYPPPDRWGTFYGQSASLVEYLVAQQGQQRFVEFVELAAAQGCEDALRHVYGVGITGLEQSWRRQVFATSISTATAQSPNRGPASAVSTRAG